jgi:hypothetical protein
MGGDDAVIALDIHRVFAEPAALEDERPVRLGRVDLRRDRLVRFAGSLPQDDHVVIERRATQPP